jgi:hypothetical protein
MVVALFCRQPSGRGVGARVNLEIAGDLATRCGGTPPGKKRRMATHRVAAFPVPSPGRGPCGMGLKENDGPPGCVRHDSNSSRAIRKSTNSVYRFVIQDALPIL